MKVIGIDPAPSKETHVVEDGALPPQKLSSEQLVDFLSHQRKQNDSLLICWDAPLTGPAYPDDKTHDHHWAGDHTKRPIEKFFSQDRGRNTPTGISVRMYAGCSHWAFSQRVVGLPRTGPFMTHWSDLPFSLVTEDEPPRPPGHYIVEVHPALAIWMWGCHANRNPDESWEYKKYSDARRELWDIVRQRLDTVGVFDEPGHFEPGDDDDFDALVSWALGELWVRGSEEVTVLGNRHTGSFLIPNSGRLSLHQEFSDVLEELNLAELEA